MATSTESGGSDFDSDSEMDDPSFCILTETETDLSNLSIKSVDADDDDPEVIRKSNVDEVAEGGFEIIEEMIEAAQIEKLKVEQCKIYLRKNGLRLAGNKATLVQRIKEHREILNGGGEVKYPVSSFVLNCKGDACTGDVVMFKQNVYEMYNIVSRSASGPPIGTRSVAGRIVKESYGTAKQQHTFTIEVLWSKGIKPFPPLHPLLIKGRNLYRLKILRQLWEDEGERSKVLMEKHSRGSLARSNREKRIQDKEKRKILREKRVIKGESNRNQSRLNPTIKVNPRLEAQQLGSSVNLGKAPPRSQQHSGLFVDSQKMAIQTHQSSLCADMGKPTICSQKSGISTDNAKVEGGAHHLTNRLLRQASNSQQLDSSVVVGSAKPSTQAPRKLGILVESRKMDLRPDLQNDVRKNCNQVPYRPVKSIGIQEVHQYMRDYGARLPDFNTNDHYYHNRNYHGQGLTSSSGHHMMDVADRQPLTSMNRNCPTNPAHRQDHQQWKICRYYAQGRCYYGNNCKFWHE